MATTINLDTSQRVDVTCRKGDTFSLRLTLTNATGDAAFAASDVFLLQVRDSDTGDADADIIQNASDVDFAITATASASDTDNKYIDLSLAASVMKTMPSGLYVYDVEQESSGTVKTLIYGTMKVNEDVSITA
jgi:hypothetical protein